MHKYQIDVGSWEVLNRLLDQALEVPPTAIDTWVEALAPEFDGLKPQLRRMLSRYARVETGDFLDTLPKFDMPPAEAGAPARTEQPGDIIGPYRLERELGSGGMGVVWLAVRTDGLIKRPVALKLPHGAWKRAGLAERMAREREILSSLAHSNIAHLYDAGVTAAGQPYLAIEYVEGTRVDVYCRERKLELRPRLELFAQAAKAVAYAHGKLVVHRDLKPANILVTAEGQVRLLDFGIAKLLEDGEARETRMTELSGRALTPDYASPEQILGEPLTIASDVYSLGVILYELLCDQRPYKLQRDSRGALEEAILLADPAPPSDMVDSRHRKALRGDLDTVVLKSLKKKPAERYPTVHALLEDIERHLSSRPVLAQRDSRWYRAKKFMARNKLAVGAAGAIALALIAGAVIAAWQARIALAEKARAEEVQTFITSVFREADPMEGEGKLSAVDLLLQAERRINERPDATAALKVELLAIIGESLFGLQENEGSARIIEDALRLQNTIPDADPLMTARLHLTLSESREMTGNIDEAVAELGKTFAVLDSTELDAGPLAVRARLHESALSLSTGDYALTERAAKQAIEEATAVLGPGTDEEAMALMFMSKAYIFTERMPQSVAPARQGLDILLANHKGDYAHPRVIDFAPFYANALIHTGDFEAAAKLTRELMTNAERVFGAQSNLVGGLAMIAVPAELESGDLDAAISLARRSLDIYLQVAQPETAVHAYRVRILAHALTVARVGDEALERTDEVLRVAANTGAPHAGRSDRGLALAHAGRLAEAGEQVRLALENTKPGTRHHMQATRHRGTLLRFEQQSSEALPWLEKSVAESKIGGFERPELAAGLVELGLARLDLGDFTAAEQSFTQADAELTKLQQQRMTPTRADLMIGRARADMQNSRLSDALRALQAADAYWRERRPDSRWAGEAALWLGRAHLALGQRAEARAALDRAAKLLGPSKIPADIALMKLTRITG